MSGAGSFPDSLSRLVARQLGREPSVRFEIAVNCIYGWPSVIRNDPVDLHGEPHPNLYYLVCPWLRRTLARLEDAGFIAGLQQRIAADAELMEDLAKNQAGHAAEYQVAMKEGGFGDSPRDMPIAGASDAKMIKCLHANMAWYLIHPDYLAGRLIAGAIGDIWCPDERCAEWMEEIGRFQPDSSDGEMA